MLDAVRQFENAACYVLEPCDIYVYALRFRMLEPPWNLYYLVRLRPLCVLCDSGAFLYACAWSLCVLNNETSVWKLGYIYMLSSAFLNNETFVWKMGYIYMLSSTFLNNETSVWKLGYMYML